MSGRFHETLHYIFSIVPAIGAFVIWITFMVSYPDIDAVSIYSFERKLSRISEVFIDDTQGRTNLQKGLQAEINLIDECVFPYVYNYITSDPSRTPSQLLQTQGITDVEGSKFQSKWSVINFDSWNLERSAISLEYTDLEATAKIKNASTRFTPTCRCMHAVLKKYKSINTINFGDTKAALLACLATRHQIPRQTVVFGSGPDDQSVSNRKSLSRTAFLLILGLATIGNLLYRKINFNLNPGESKWLIVYENWGKLTGLAIIILAIWFVPASNTALNQSNLMSFQAVMMFPGLFLFGGVELIWHLTGHEIRRQVYPHPFFFFLSLTSLYAMALVENGVFTLDVLMSYYWLSVTTACVYAAVIFCSLNRVWELESSRSGYILLLLCSCIAVAIKLVPTFPINCSLNILWLMPAVYAGIHFFGIILAEQISGAHKPTDNSFTRSAYYISMGQFLITVAVIFYFSGKLQFLSMGDTSLRNANLVPSKPNFELFTNGGRFYGS